MLLMSRLQLPLAQMLQVVGITAATGLIHDTCCVPIRAVPAADAAPHLH
jgi:hypothetical protein